MNRWRTVIAGALMVLGLGFATGGRLDCDFDDDELEFRFGDDEIEIDFDDDGIDIDFDD